MDMSEIISKLGDIKKDELGERTFYEHVLQLIDEVTRSSRVFI